MRRILIALLFLSSVAIGAWATPAKRGVWKTMKLADGQEVRVELRGDEYLSYWQTADGKSYVKAFGQKHLVEVDASVLFCRAMEKRAQNPLPRTQSRSRVDIGDSHPDFVGHKKGLIILAEFTDRKFQPGHDAEYYSHVANDLNFTHKDGFVGSIRDYFLAQSEGRFDLTFDVVGPVALAHDMEYYGGHDSYGNTDKNAQAMVRECVVAAANILPDFSEYDWFGDGNVDQVFVIYAGRGEADSGDENTIWPHRWELYPRLTLGGKRISVYACSNELQTGGGDKETIDGIGAFCHEFSHCLGLPDLYDVEQFENYGMSYWDVMDVGCYLGNSFRPCSYSGYEKNYCGWKTPIVLENDTSVVGVKGMSEGGDYFIVYNDAHKDEYYILENRTRTGWDTGLYGSGLLITHIDYDRYVWASNLVNSTGSVNDHQRYTLFLADNDASLMKASEIMGDLYPWKTNNSLTNNSVPAASLFNANVDGGNFMNKPVLNIRKNGDGTVSFDFRNENKTGVPEAIEGVALDRLSSCNAPIYSLDGRLAGNCLGNLAPGIYVVNGKKIVK